MTLEIHATPQTLEGASAAGERIHRLWHDALAHDDANALAALYASDAILESPLIPHLTGSEIGILRGRDEIRAFLERIVTRKPEVRRHFRSHSFGDGKTVMWEYPRETPTGEQMDFVEVIELNDHGLIQRHRVYWGWFGVGMLTRDAHHR